MHTPSHFGTRVPWRNSRAWRNVHEAVGRMLRGNPSFKADALRKGRQIKEGLERLFPIMDRLCSGTCPVCPDPCCRRATLWFDFRDVLFSHVGKLPVPPRQIAREPNGACIHLGPTGCRLPRLQRPWICTFYVCPAQSALLKDSFAGDDVRVSFIVGQIKAVRKELEMKFEGIF
jgi:hypothetical protein